MTCISFKTTNKLYSLLLPKNLVLDKYDIISLGLLKGEMISSTKGKSKHYTSFTNSESRLINLVIRFLKRMNIKIDHVTFQIIINTKENKPLEDHFYIDWWSKVLDVPKTNFVKIYKDSRYRTKNKNGAISLKYYSTPFRTLIQFLVNFIDKFNKSDCKNFIKGIMAAEGSISLSNNGSLNFISIGGSKDADIFLYRKCLEKIGIKPGATMKAVTNEDAINRGWKGGTGGYMVIQGWYNFCKIYNYALLDIFPEKKLKFFYGLKNHKIAQKQKIYNKIIIELDELIKNYPDIYSIIVSRKNKLTCNEKMVLELLSNRNKTTTISELASILKINRSSASRILEGIRRKGKIIKYREGRKFIWKVL